MKNQKPKSRWRLWKWLGGILGLVLLLLVLFSLLVTTDRFWKWAAPKIVVAVNDRVNGEVTVDKIYGNPLTALVFEKVVVTGHQDEVLRAKELQITLSLLSILKLEPEINAIEISGLQVNLNQDHQGRWNVTGLLKERPPPPFKELHFPDISIVQGEVRLTRPGQELLIRRLDLKLDDLIIKNPGRLDQVIQVRSGHLAFTPPNLPRITLQSKLSVSALKLQLDSLNITLNDQPAGLITGSLTRLDHLPELILDIRLLPLSGKQVRGIWPKWPLDQKMAGDLKLTGDIRHIRGTGKICLGKCHIALNGGLNYENSANLDYWLNVRVDSLSADILRAIAVNRFPAEAKLSPLGGSLSLAGTGLPWSGGRLQSNLKIRPFQYNQAEVTETQINFDISEDSQQQLKAEVKGNFGRLAAHGSGRLVPGLGPKPGLSGELEAKVEQLNPALLAGQKAPAGRVEGNFTGQFTWPEPGNLSLLEAQGTLTAKGTLQEYIVQELRVQGQWQQNVLKLPQARLRLAGVQAALQGSVQRTGADLNFNLELSPQAQWPLVPAGLKGEVKARGSFRGSWASPHLRLTASGQRLAWHQLSVESLQISGDSRGWPPDVARLELTGKKFKSPWLSLFKVRLTSQAQQRQVAFDLRLDQPKQSVGLVGGTLNLQSRPYLLSVDTCRLGTDKHQVVSLAPIQLRFAPEGFELSPASFRYRDCTVNLGGIANQQALSFRVDVERFPVAVLNNLWPSVPLLEGALDLQSKAKGSLRSPMIDGRLTISPGRVADFEFQTFRLDWTYATDQLQIDGQLREKADGPGLLLNGQIPLSLSFCPLVVQAREQGLQIRLQGEKLNLAMVSDLIPAVEAAQSGLEVQAQLTGSLKNPHIAGKVKWGSGFLKLREAGVPYDLAAGELHLDQEKVTLPRLVLHSGEGRASLSGTMTLVGLEPRAVDYRLQSTNFLALNRAGSRAVANGQINLSGTWPHLEVHGQVTIPEAQIKLSLFQAAGHPEIRVIKPQKASPVQTPAQKESEDSALWKNLLIKLNIKLPGKVWVREKDLKANLTGGIRVIKIPPRPLFLAGKVQSLQGSIILNRKVFDIEHALVTFPGSPGGLIMLDARARHEMDDVTLIIVASGPVTNPRTHLESMPPLSQPDVLSYLLFDRPANAITREHGAMSILGGITAEKMKDFFGGAIPLVESLSLNGGGGAVGVGKKLTKDITVSYERNLDPLSAEDVNQFRVEYKLNKYLSLESQFGRRNPGGDIFLNFDF
ncbi:MAG: translocation/assembly module TamB [Deltaproteobacteria bacterium]|nr:translocation/assembly module TamB [Deltaproteobacteria bacterium]